MANLDRKLELWRLLHGAREGLGLKQLAGRLGVSKNTVQRDIDELSRSGVPVEESQVGQALRYQVRGASAPSVAIHGTEDAALQAAEVVLARYGAVGFAEGVRAVHGRLSPVQISPSLFDAGHGRLLAGPPPGVVETLERAMAERRPCRLVYTRRFASESRQYTVEPHRFLLADGVGYLLGRVPPLRGPTTFALHLVEGIELLEGTFRPQSWARTAFKVIDEAPRRVAVRFAPEVACFIAEREWHPTQRCDSEPDGSLVLRARLSGKTEFLSWVLSWAPWAELLAPADWRQELRDRAAATMARHRNPAAPSGPRERRPEPTG